MDTINEPLLSGCVVLLYCVLRETHPEAVAATGMLIGTILLTRAFYVYWRLLGDTVNEESDSTMVSDITGLYVLVNFYRKRGWSAVMGTLGNVGMAGLVFIGSLMSGAPVPAAL